MTETFYEVLRRQGITRRSFLKFCSLTVAPTEWNFHPRGLLPHALGGQCAADKDTLFKQTQLLVNAIDPCVDYRIQIH